MKRIILFLSGLIIFIGIIAMEMPQPMQSEATPIKTGTKRAAEETIAPETQKAVKTGETEAIATRPPISH